MTQYQDLAYVYVPPVPPLMQDPRQTANIMAQHWPGDPVTSWQSMPGAYKSVTQDFMQMGHGANPVNQNYPQHSDNWRLQQPQEESHTGVLQALPQNGAMNMTKGVEHPYLRHHHPGQLIFLSHDHAVDGTMQHPHDSPVSRDSLRNGDVIIEEVSFAEAQLVQGAALSSTPDVKDSELVSSCELICSHSSGACATETEEVSFQVDLEKACVLKLTQEGRYPAYVIVHIDAVSNVEQMKIDSVEEAKNAEVSITEEGIKIVSLLPEAVYEKHCVENKITYIVKSKEKEVIKEDGTSPITPKLEDTVPSEQSEKCLDIHVSEEQVELSCEDKHEQKVQAQTKKGRFKRSCRRSNRIKQKNNEEKQNGSTERVISSIDEEKMEIKTEIEDMAVLEDSVQEDSFLVNDQWTWPYDFPLKDHYCDICQDNHEKPCRLLRHKGVVQDNLTCVNSSIRAIVSLPNELSLSLSENSTHGISVFAATDIPARTVFGPLVGEPIGEDEIQRNWDMQHIWCLDFLWDKCETFLNTKNECTSNWCRYLRPTVDIKNANLVGIKKGDKLFFVSKSTLVAGDELIYYIGCMTKAFCLSAKSTQWPVKEDFEEFTSCFKCNITFHCAFNFAKHVKLIHPKGINKVCQKCKFCNVKLESMKALERHFRAEHGGVGCFDCKKCDKAYLNMHRLRQHMKMSHYEGDCHICQECGKVLPSPTKLKEHLRISHSSERFACDREQCNKVFTTRTSLYRHKKVHSRVPLNFLCNTCGKTFRDGTNLKVHLLTHSGVKPFQCREDQCSAAFTTKQCLQVHYRKVHNYSEEKVPDIHRMVPFTVAAYTTTKEEEEGMAESGDTEVMDASVTLLQLHHVFPTSLVQEGQLGHPPQ